MWRANRDPKELQQAVDYVSQQPLPHWSMNQHEHRPELSKIMHDATRGVTATKVKPMSSYVTADILEVSAHRARLIRTKPREEQQVQRLDRKRIFAVWREVSHWVAGHTRPSHVDLDAFGPFRSKIYVTPEGINAYQKYWRQVFQASAKAERVEIALGGYQQIQRANLKEALKSILMNLCSNRQ